MRLKTRITMALLAGVVGLIFASPALANNSTTVLAQFNPKGIPASGLVVKYEIKVPSGTKIWNSGKDRTGATVWYHYTVTTKDRFVMTDKGARKYNCANPVRLETTKPSGKVATGTVVMVATFNTTINNIDKSKTINNIDKSKTVINKTTVKVTVTGPKSVAKVKPKPVIKPAEPKTPPVCTGITMQQAGLLVRGEATVSHAKGPFLTYWNWGDGSYWGVPPQAGLSASHTYAAGNGYKVSATVQYQDGKKVVKLACGTRLILVTAPASTSTPAPKPAPTPTPQPQPQPAPTTGGGGGGGGGGAAAAAASSSSTSSAASAAAGGGGGGGSSGGGGGGGAAASSSSTSSTTVINTVVVNNPPPPPVNHSPAIQWVNLPAHVFARGQVQVCVLASDPDANTTLTVTFSAQAGTVSTAYRPDPSGSPAKWCTLYTAPSNSGAMEALSATASDGIVTTQVSGSFLIPSASGGF